MADLDNTIGNAQAQIDIALDELYGNGPAIIELVKVKINFWDKLVVLDAGALALLFSIAGTSHRPINGDGGTGYLFAASKLMILSIASALIAQWCAVAAATHMQRHRLALKVHMKMQRAADLLARDGNALLEPHSSFMNQMEREVVEMQPKARRLELISHIAGSIAWLSAIAGLCWLYKFVHVLMGKV